MKKSLASILAAALVLSAMTGCSDGTANSDESSSQSVSEISENSSESSAQTPSTTSSSTSSAASEALAIDEDFVVPHSEISLNIFKDPKTAQDFDEAMGLMRQYAYWQFTIIHPNEKSKEEDPVYMITDKEQSIRRDTEDNPYWYYKVVKGEMSSEKLFNEALDKIFTEQFKKEFFEYNKDDMIVSDGHIYLNSRMKRMGGVGMGKSYLELNSFEYPDENTILMTVTDVGDKDEWGLENDLRETLTVKFVRENDALKIAEVSNAHSVSYAFGFYSRLYCGNFRTNQ